MFTDITLPISYLPNQWNELTRTPVREQILPLSHPMEDYVIAPATRTTLKSIALEVQSAKDQSTVSQDRHLLQILILSQSIHLLTMHWMETSQMLTQRPMPTSMSSRMDSHCFPQADTLWVSHSILLLMINFPSSRMWKSQTTLPGLPLPIPFQMGPSLPDR